MGQRQISDVNIFLPKSKGRYRKQQSGAVSVKMGASFTLRAQSGLSVCACACVPMCVRRETDRQTETDTEGVREKNYSTAQPKAEEADTPRKWLLFPGPPGRHSLTVSAAEAKCQDRRNTGLEGGKRK